MISMHIVIYNHVYIYTYVYIYMCVCVGLNENEVPRNQMVYGPIE
jgi:hypothetical protein